MLAASLLFIVPTCVCSCSTNGNCYYPTYTACNVAGGNCASGASTTSWSIATILEDFMSNPAISNGEALDPYYDTSSMSAYAKFSVLNLALMQQQYLLGQGAQWSAVQDFASTAAGWLQASDAVAFRACAAGLQPGSP